MKHASPFVISELTNPSEDIVFQLYARIDGKCFRKNFPTRAEAERQLLEIQQHKGEACIHTAVKTMAMNQGMRTARGVTP
jgi:hypothetical protein